MAHSCVGISQQEDALNLSVPRQRRRRRRKIEIEAERAAKRRNLMEMVAQLRENQVVSENGQEKVVDLSKASREAASSTSSFSSLTSKFILPNVSAPMSDAFKTQMELLQAGLSRTPARHLLNGSLADGEPPMKRRRGRRKNVEGLDLLFMSHKRTSLSAVSPGLAPPTCPRWRPGSRLCCPLRGAKAGPFR